MTETTTEESGSAYPMHVLAYLPARSRLFSSSIAAQDFAARHGLVACKLPETDLWYVQMTKDVADWLAMSEAIERAHVGPLIEQPTAMTGFTLSPEPDPTDNLREAGIVLAITAVIVSMIPAILWLWMMH